MDPIFIFLSFLIGLAAGTLGGIFGIGGAVFTIPMFHVLLGLSGQEAVATALPLTIPTALGGSWAYLKHNLLKKRTILLCGIAGSISSIFGALLTTDVSSSLLMLATGALFLLLSIATYIQPPFPSAEKCSLHEKAAKSAGIGAFAGFFSGFFGIGGGPILVPLLTYIRQIPMKKAIPCSLAIIGIYAIPGSITHLYLGNINIPVLLIAAFGSIIGVQLGAHFSLGIKEERMRRMFSLLLFALGAVLIANELARGA